MKLDNDIASRRFARVYLLYGEESYLRGYYAKELCNAIVPETDNMNRLQQVGANASEEEIIEFSETLPFLSDYRLVFVKDSGFFKAQTERLPKYLQDIPDSSVLVFSESEIDKRNKLFKAVQKLGKVEEFAPQTESYLTDWAGGIFAQAGFQSERQDVSRLVSAVGTDMGRLLCEVDKVIFFCTGKTRICWDDMQAVIVPLTENRIFDMVEAAVCGDKKKALEYYADLLALKEPPMRILYLIARQYSQLMTVRVLLDDGCPDIAQKSGLHPYAVKKLSAMARQFTRRELEKAVRSCIDLEELVKTGRLADKLSVELALLGI